MLYFLSFTKSDDIRFDCTQLWLEFSMKCWLEKRKQTIWFWEKNNSFSKRMPQFWHKELQILFKGKIKSMKVFRLKAAILGLQFVKSMMFNCWNPSPREPKGTQGNPREPKGTSLGDPWWSLVTPFTNDVIGKQIKKNEKKGENSQKTGVNDWVFFPKKLKPNYQSNNHYYLRLLYKE